MATFQIYVDRGNGLELDGCWGSENARYDNEADAIEGAKFLHGEYDDCSWVVVDDSDDEEVFRIDSRRIEDDGVPVKSIGDGWYEADDGTTIYAG